MYLSKLTLNSRLKQVRRDIANPYEMHATLMHAIPEPTQERLLWRLEQQPHETVLLVQTLTLPEWPVLFKRHPEYATLDSASPKVFEPELSLEQDQLLRFRLKANPTVTKFDSDKGRSKRLGVVKLEEQLAWLQRQGQRGGFEIVGAMVSHSERARMYKSGKDEAGKHRITIQSVTYDGHLRIHQVNDFSKVLRRGLGHARALGFGLLSVGGAS